MTTPLRKKGTDTQHLRRVYILSSHNGFLGLEVSAFQVFSVLAEGVIPNAQQLLLKGGVDPNTLMIRTNIIGAVGGAVGLAVCPDVCACALTSALIHCKGAYVVHHVFQ